ncbi:MAG: DUF3726 domain-containing protein [Pseudomonadota bacterium]
MTASLSEIEAMGRKAARGAGYSWGLAEEAGRTTRWLSAHGLAGVSCLASVLEQVAEDFDAHRPELRAGIWQADRAVCPIQFGAIMSDRAVAIGKGAVVRAAPMPSSILLLPPLCWSAQALACGFSVTKGERRLLALPSGPVIEPLLQDHGLPQDMVEIRAYSSSAEGLQPLAQGEKVDASVWEFLAELASRTYVPATEASRSGAGAGATDND